MLDIRFLRENPEVVKQNIRNKFQDSKLPLVDEVIALDIRNREIKQEVEALRAEKNKVSKMIGACMAQGKREEAEEYKRQVAANAGRTEELSKEEKEVEEKIKTINERKSCIDKDKFSFRRLKYNFSHSHSMQVCLDFKIVR